jgi:hypothetical protein
MGKWEEKNLGSSQFPIIPSLLRRGIWEVALTKKQWQSLFCYCSFRGYILYYWWGWWGVVVRFRGTPMKTRTEREQELKQKITQNMGIWELKALVRKYKDLHDNVPIQIGDSLLIEIILEHEYLGRKQF